MTPTDTPAFRAALRRLETAYGAGVDPARDPVFFDALEPYPITIVLSAARDLERRPPPSRRFPTTHDWCDRARELRAGHATTPRPPDLILDADDPPMSASAFRAALETLRKKLSVRHATMRRHSTPTAVSQIAQSLTHPHAVPHAREPSDDDLPDSPPAIQPDGAEDDPDAV